MCQVKKNRTTELEWLREVNKRMKRSSRKSKELPKEEIKTIVESDTPRRSKRVRFFPERVEEIEQEKENPAFENILDEFPDSEQRERISQALSSKIKNQEELEVIIRRATNLKLSEYLKTYLNLETVDAKRLALVLLENEKEKETQFTESEVAVIRDFNMLAL